MRSYEHTIDINMLITIIRIVKPFELKGDKEVAELICAITAKQFTQEGVRMRVRRGFYKKGEDFRETGGKMRVWNREAVIARELQIIKGNGYEVS